MKILEQYIYAIGQKLPMKGRQDIKDELKSLLLDDIEDKYGAGATEENYYAAIKAFGSPSEVARRYSGNRVPISPALSELYFMICKIVVLAMSIAFTVVMVIELISGDLRDNRILLTVLNLPFRILTGTVSGVGIVTLIFMAITRWGSLRNLDPGKDWSPKELEGIQIGPEKESRIGGIVSIVFLAVLALIINVYPQIISAAERAFIPLTAAFNREMHTIVLEVFRLYAAILAVLWGAQIVFHILVMKRGGIRTPKLEWMEYILSVLSIVLMIIMVIDSRLYMNETGLIGFRIIFLIILIVSSVELLVALAKKIYRRVQRNAG